MHKQVGRINQSKYPCKSTKSKSLFMQTNLPAIPLNRDSILSLLKTSTITKKNETKGDSTLFLRKSLQKKLQLFFILLLAFQISKATDNTWKGLSSNWNLASNWSGGIPTSTSDVIIPVLGGTIAFNPILSSAGVCRTIKQMGAGTSISGSVILTISATGNTSIPSSATISCPLNLSASTTFSNSGALLISGPLSGSGNLTKSGGGTLTFDAATTTINALTISSGTVTMSAAATFAAITINGGTLNLAGTTTVTGTLALTSGSLVIGSNTLIANGAITQVAGALSGSSSSNLTLGGSGSQSLYFASTDTLLNNLTLNHTSGATAVLNTSLAIMGSIKFNSGNDILDINHQHLTIHSDIYGTGYIGEIKGSLINADNVTAERYIDGTTGLNGKRSWRLLTIPVTGLTIRDAWCGAPANPNATQPNSENSGNGTLITGHGYSDGTLAAAAGFDWFSGLGSNTTSSIRYYDAAHSWASVTNTPSTLSVPDKQGYMLYVRGDRTVASSVDTGYTTLRPTGTLKQGTQTIPVNDAYTVVGNPYASPINLDAVYLNTSNNSVIKRNFWIWDATQGTSGGYRSLSWNGRSYDMTGGAGTASDYLIVNSGQAFFVEKNSTGNITITENNKTTITPQTVFRPMGVTGGVTNLSIKLYLATGSTLGVQADGVVARYNNIYSVSPYETYDVPKLNNFNENLSLVRDNRYLSVESRPLPTSNDTLFIPFWGLTARDYALTITSNLLMGLNQTAILIDHFTNTSTQVDMNNATILYPFTITGDPASKSLNRFTIVMSQPAFGVLPVTFTKIHANTYGSIIKINWSTSSESGIRDYDVEKSADGIHFSKIATIAAANAAIGGSYQLADDAPFKGDNFYRIRGNDQSGRITYSSIALAKMNAKNSIQITPTVITNMQFTLSFNNESAGNFRLLLTNAAGQQVYQKTVNSSAGQQQLITLPKVAAVTGIYQLSVTDTNGRVQSFKVLIRN
jgi:hypothetical protein